MSFGRRLLNILNRPFGKTLAQAGMSLIEIIIVIALMGTLMTIIISKLTGAQDNAMEDSARLAMQQMDQTLQMYKVHNYKFPSTDEGLDALVTAPASAKRWRGPYIEKKKLDDPWGQPYAYESDGQTFKIISAGKDGSVGTEDDLTYPAEDGGGQAQAE